MLKTNVEIEACRNLIKFRYNCQSGMTDLAKAKEIMNDLAKAIEEVQNWQPDFLDKVEEVLGKVRKRPFVSTLRNATKPPMIVKRIKNDERNRRLKIQYAASTISSLGPDIDGLIAAVEDIKQIYEMAKNIDTSDYNNLVDLKEKEKKQALERTKKAKVVKRNFALNDAMIAEATEEDDDLDDLLDDDEDDDF